VVIRDEEWETLFCTKIEKLISYSNKIANYYEAKLQKREKETKAEEPI
jgi:hypothetical protein